MNSTETLIVGAGPSGLAAAACLRRRGRPLEVLDKADRVGSSWRNHYARLHLHTVKAHSALPGMPFPAHYPRYPSRQQVVDYLESYANQFGVEPRFGVTVQRATRDGDGWRVETDQGDWRARNLVVATGYNAEPRVPAWPGREAFRGQVIHSRAYRDGAPFAGQRVMVVGAGNSGAEIAIDLFEHGAREIHLCVRGPIHVVPREVTGLPAQIVGIAYSRMPLRVADALSQVLVRLAIPSLKKYGLTRPRISPVRSVETLGRVPLIDVGTLALIEQGKIRVVPGVERFTETGVRFVDGREVELDAVVLATGYKARLDRFLPDADRLVDDRGYPRWHGAPIEGFPGLYFIGYANPISGALREAGLEAERVARHIARA